LIIASELAKLYFTLPLNGASHTKRLLVPILMGGELTMNDVYINRLAKYLPNDPVSNDEMEAVLGMVNHQPSRARKIVLRQNGIKTRYYAINKQGQITHNNAQLTAEAVKKLTDEEFTLNDIQLLCCGTTSPDQLVPSHASMVHGILKNRALEINSPSGVCCSGMQAFKYGYQMWRHQQRGVHGLGDRFVCSLQSQVSERDG
jgi:3-oxoacyl-[acyl-carrier-protein] synthase III